MEKTITLRLLSTGRIRIVEPDDGEPDSIIGFQSENNATNLKLILCSGVYSLKHYIEILAPDGTATSTQALTEDIDGSEHSVTLALSAEYIPEDGRYAVQYVGRNDDGTLVVKSSIIALDVGSSINAVQPGGPNNDWISWAEQEFADLDARITEAENDTVRATNNFGTDAVILVADGTKKQAKSGGKTIAGLTAEIEAAAHADAVAEVNAEKARAQQAEGDEALARANADTALGNRITALENDEDNEVRADSNFTDSQIIIADGATKKVKKSGKTITEVLAEAASAAHTDALSLVNAEKERSQGVEGSLGDRVTALENGEGAEVHADSNFGTNEVILVADGTGKKIKAGSKTIAGIEADIQAEATRAGNAEGALAERVTALENGESSHTDAQSNFDANEIVVGVGGSKMVKGSGSTITQVNSRLGELEDKKGKLIVPDTDNSTSYVVELKVENGKLCLYYD